MSSLKQQASGVSDLKRRLGVSEVVDWEMMSECLGGVELAFERLSRRRSALADSFELQSRGGKLVLQLADLTLGLLELAIHGPLELQVLGVLLGEFASIGSTQHDALKNERGTEDAGEGPQDEDRAHGWFPWKAAFDAMPRSLEAGSSHVVSGASLARQRALNSYSRNSPLVTSDGRRDTSSLTSSCSSRRLVDEASSQTAAIERLAQRRQRCSRCVDST